MERAKYPGYAISSVQQPASINRFTTVIEQKAQIRSLTSSEESKEAILHRNAEEF
jgi:hypothetical protein